MARTHLVESTLELVLPGPVAKPVSQLTVARRPLQGGLADRDRLLQSSCSIVQIAEPQRGRNMPGVESEGALEPGSCHFVLPEHESGDARSEGESGVARLHRSCLGKGSQGVTETVGLDRGRTGTRERARILATSISSYKRDEAQRGRRGEPSDRHYASSVQKEPRENCGKTSRVFDRHGILSLVASTKVCLAPVAATHHDVCNNVWMATNLDLDPALVDEAVAVGGRRTKKEAVTEALREYIARRRQRYITALFGKVTYEPTYNYKKQRRRR